jgi:aspartate/methionine/tyrosine aminotransferase
MPALHPLARELNAVLEREWPLALHLLSRRGAAMYFPKTGILGQSAEAAGRRINATIGIALEEDGSPMHHRFFDDVVVLPATDVYPYAPSFGLSEFRKVWQEQIRSKNPALHTSISLPVVTAGLTHALSTAAALFLDPGDSLLTTDLHWDNCTLIFEENIGARILPFPSFDGDRLAIDALADALGVGGRGKKVVLLNFPNNPTGYSPTLQEAQSIADALTAEARRGSDIAVILDDAYFGFFYGADVWRQSLIALLGDCHDRILVAKVDGPTKEDCTWGHRIGCLTFAGKGMTSGSAKALEAKAAGFVRATISNASHPAQSMLLALYRSKAHKAERQRMHGVLERRHQLLRESLKVQGQAQGLFRVLPSNAGYFLCVELLQGMEGEAVRRMLLERYDTGVIAFGRLLRIAYSCLPEQSIPEFCQNLAAACHSLLPSLPLRSHATAIA